MSLTLNAFAQQMQHHGQPPVMDLIPISPVNEGREPAKKKHKAPAQTVPTSWTIPCYAELVDINWKGHDSTNKRQYFALVSIIRQLQSMQIKYFPAQAPTVAYTDYDRLV